VQNGLQRVPKMHMKTKNEFQVL